MWAFACAGLPATAQDLSEGDDTFAVERTFLELTTPRPAVFVGEPFELTLRVGVEEGFLRQSMIQPFRQELDVPVQVLAPWLGIPRDARRLERAPSTDALDGERLSLVLGEEVVSARRVEDLAVDGRHFVVLELARRYVPERPGTLEVPAPELRLAYATRFRDDALHGRVPEDRVDAVVPGRPLSLGVLALPEAARPPGFGGAVGDFRVSASASTRSLTAGETLALTLRIEGSGDLDAFEPPRLDDLPRFRVYGRIERRTATAREVIYDLAPEDEFVEELPAIPFDYFDPSPPGAYRTARSAPIALEVAPRATVAENDGQPPAGAPAPVPPEETREPEGSGWLPLLAIPLAALFLAGLLLLRRRPPTRGPQASGALEAFRSHAEVDLRAAFAEYLAARLGCPVPAVIGHDLGARLIAAGVPEDLARRAAQLLEELVAAHFGGEAPAEGAARAADLVEELQRAFDAAPA